MIFLNFQENNEEIKDLWHGVKIIQKRNIYVTSENNPQMQDLCNAMKII